MQQPRWICINFCEMSCCSIFWMFGPWLSVNPPRISTWPSNIAPVWIRTVLESSNDKTNTESQSSIERLWNVKLQLSGLLWDWFWASCPFPLPSLNVVPTFPALSSTCPPIYNSLYPISDSLLLLFQAWLLVAAADLKLQPGLQTCPTTGHQVSTATEDSGSSASCSERLHFAASLSGASKSLSFKKLPTCNIFYWVGRWLSAPTPPWTGI